MDTGTSYAEALDMPLPELVEFWNLLCDITGERDEAERQEIEKARQGVKKT